MADKKKYRRSNGEGKVYGDTRAKVVEKLAALRGSIDAHKLKPSTRTTVGQFMVK
jgi:hypothetical protein